MDTAHSPKTVSAPIPPPPKNKPFMIVTLLLIIVVAGLAGSIVLFQVTFPKKKVTIPVVTPSVTLSPTQTAVVNPFASPTTRYQNPFVTPTTSYENPFGSFENPFANAAKKETSGNQPYQNPFK